jgi:hypothetical protein
MAKKNTKNNHASPAACLAGRRGRRGGDCEKYGIAVMNLVMGEDIGMTQDQLMNHLRECKQCRADLFEWRDTYQVMRMEADAKKPEHKQKVAEMVARIKRKLLECTEVGKKIDQNQEIGTPAGKLWEILAREGPIRVSDIPEKMRKDYDIDQAFAAYGWLALEKKVDIFQGELGKCVDLTKDEAAKISSANI